MVSATCRTRLACLRAILPILAAVIAIVPSTHAAEKFEYGLEFWPPSGNAGDDDQIPWVKVLTVMKDNLGRTKQLNYFVDACYAGQAIEQSNPTGGIDLGIPYTMSVATPKDRLMRFGWNSDDVQPPGRLKIGDRYYYSFNDYLTKRLQNKTPVPTVKNLFDAAKADVIAEPKIPEGRTPQFVKRGAGDDGLKIKGDANKSRALVFGADMNEMYFDPHDESYRALNAYTFDSIVMYRHSVAQDLNRNPPIQGKGTWANFKTAMADLKAQMANGNDKTEMVNVFHVGHGYRSTIDDGKPPGLLIAGSARGRVLAGRASLSSISLTIPMDPDYWSTLKAGLLSAPPSDSALTRIEPARFFVAYSRHHSSQSLNVSIAGRPLGSFALPSAPPSGTLTVPLADAFVLDLIAHHDGESHLPIQFDLAPGDSLRIGVVEDLLNDPNYVPTTYGTGLSTVVASIGDGSTSKAAPAATPRVLVAIAILICLTGGAMLSRRIAVDAPRA
jgi:hypothetical protein